MPGILNKKKTLAMLGKIVDGYRFVFEEDGALSAWVRFRKRYRRALNKRDAPALIARGVRVQYTVFEVMVMRTNIVIDDELMKEAFKVSGGVSTKKELVELALKEFVDTRKRKNFRELRGRIAFADEYEFKSMRQ